jgi:hypothetical protein
VTSDQFAALVDRITYRPGWTFTVHDDLEGTVLRINAAVLDRDGNGDTTLGISTHVPLRLIRSQGDALEFLRWRLTRIANHEVREFLRIDADRRFDPHAVTTP